MTIATRQDGTKSATRTSELLALMDQGYLIRYAICGSDWPVEYAPRSKRDPLPWVQKGGLGCRLRAGELTAVPAPVGSGRGRDQAQKVAWREAMDRLKVKADADRAAYRAEMDARKAAERERYTRPCGTTGCTRGHRHGGTCQFPQGGYTVVLCLDDTAEVLGREDGGWARTLDDAIRQACRAMESRAEILRVEFSTHGRGAQPFWGIDRDGTQHNLTLAQSV